MIDECKKLWLMFRTNMLEQPNFADWLSKCLKNNLFSQKLSLKSQPVSCRRHCRHRKKATLPVMILACIKMIYVHAHQLLAQAVGIALGRC